MRIMKLQNNKLNIHLCPLKIFIFKNRKIIKIFTKIIITNNNQYGSKIILVKPFLKDL